MNSFDHSHPDKEKGERCQRESQRLNHQGIKSKDHDTEEGPQPGTTGPEGHGGSFFPPAEDQGQGEEDKDDAKSKREKPHSGMSEAPHLKMRRTPGTHHADHQQDVTCYTIPFFDGFLPPIIGKPGTTRLALMYNRCYTRKFALNHRSIGGAYGIWSSISPCIAMNNRFLWAMIALLLC
jgi:hypothetical protein